MKTKIKDYIFLWPNISDMSLNYALNICPLTQHLICPQVINSMYVLCTKTPDTPLSCKLNISYRTIWIYTSRSGDILCMDGKLPFNLLYRSLKCLQTITSCYSLASGHRSCMRTGEHIIYTVISWTLNSGCCKFNLHTPQLEITL